MGTAIKIFRTPKVDINKEVEFVGHGLGPITTPKPAYIDGSGNLQLAQANDDTKLKAFFITEVLSPDRLRLSAQFTTVTGHGLSIGEYYYTSSTTAGDYSTAPANINDVLWFVFDANTLILLDNRPLSNDADGYVQYNPKSSAYTLIEPDFKKVVECTGSFAVELPPGISSNPGWWTVIRNVGVGVISFTAGSGVTANDIAITLDPNQSMIVEYRSTNYYYLEK